MDFLSQLTNRLDLALLEQVINDGRILESTLREQAGGEYGRMWDWYKAKLSIDNAVLAKIAKLHKISLKSLRQNKEMMRKLIRKFILGMLKNAGAKELVGPVKYEGITSLPDATQLRASIEIGIPKTSTPDVAARRYKSAISAQKGVELSIAAPIRRRSASVR